jgi:GNAT superfamily N-acetyltransferase
MLSAVSGDTNAVRVRPVNPDDASAVAGLLEQLGYPADESGVRDRIAAWADDDRGGAFAATIGDRLVGCAAIYVVPFFERPGSRARLVALVVDGEHRKRGIGRLLVGQAHEFARRRGAVEIEVTSRRERADADRFYTGLGFSDVTGRSRRYVANTV